MSRKLAIFVLDNTLTHGDTLVPWLIALSSRNRFLRAAVRAGISRFSAPALTDRRTVFKEALQVPLLTGVTVENGISAAKRIAPTIRWKKLAPQALMNHAENGVHILIATGAARMAAEHFVAHRFPVKFDMLGTELEVVDGMLTGRLAGENCVRQTKARLVREYLDEHGPFDEIWGYGNAPHDLPMLELVDHKTVI